MLVCNLLKACECTGCCGAGHDTGRHVLRLCLVLCAAVTLVLRPSCLHLQTCLVSGVLSTTLLAMTEACRWQCCLK